MKLQCSKLDILAIIVLVALISCITALIVIDGNRHGLSSKDAQEGLGYVRIYEDGSYVDINNKIGCFEWGICND